MAITRRQFVTRLSTLAAAMGMSQVDLAKVTEVFAHGSVWAAANSWDAKPKVVWVHGAECTGCSTSLLSLFEDVRGKAIEGAPNIAGQPNMTLTALDFAVGGDGDGSTVLTADVPAGHPYAHRTLSKTRDIVGCDFDSYENDDTPYVANIADVLIDFIDLQYHETVMSMGGDLAYKWLNDMVTHATGGTPFVLVVEGAIQPRQGGGYWDDTVGAAGTPWCSIGMGATGGELAFDDVVLALAKKSSCKAVIPIGQCACFGGYPACESPVLKSDAQGKAMGTASMTGAMGTYKFLDTYDPIQPSVAAAKVVNVPGCPTNPWWFILTVVAWLVDFTQPGEPLNILDGDKMPMASAIDTSRRLKAVYGVPLHGPYCKRYQSALDGVFATKPGDPGCLQLIGCKGPQVGTLCGPHGWNAQNPRNYAVDATLDHGVAGINGTKGGNCVAGGHPCMACTEEGYPDSFVPFVIR